MYWKSCYELNDFFIMLTSFPYLSSACELICIQEMCLVARQTLLEFNVSAVEWFQVMSESEHGSGRMVKIRVEVHGEKRGPGVEVQKQ